MAPTAPRGAARCWSHSTTRSSASRRSGRSRSPAPTPPFDHPWRIALALLEDAFDGQRAARRAPVVLVGASRRTCTIVRQMIARRFRSPLAHGAGRYFDGIGSLVLARPDSQLRGTDRARVEHGRAPDERDVTPTTWTIGLRRGQSTCARWFARSCGTCSPASSRADNLGALPQHDCGGDRPRSSARGAANMALCRSCSRAGVFRTRVSQKASAARSVVALHGTICTAACRRATAASRSDRRLSRRDGGGR